MLVIMRILNPELMLKVIVLGMVIVQSSQLLCCRDNDEGNINTIVFVPANRGCNSDTTNVYVESAEFTELVRE
jgi:hypothetical protein